MFSETLKHTDLKMKYSTQLRYNLMKDYNSAKQTPASIQIQIIKLWESFNFISSLTFSPPSPISTFSNAQFSH